MSEPSLRDQIISMLTAAGTLDQEVVDGAAEQADAVLAWLADWHPLAPSEPDVLADAASWLSLCGRCDAGLPQACSCLPGDVRAVLEMLVAELTNARHTIARAVVARRRQETELTELAAAFMPAERGSEWALYLHRCGNTEWWSETLHGPINTQGCDACEAGPDQGWQPVYVRAKPLAEP